MAKSRKRTASPKPPAVEAEAVVIAAAIELPSHHTIATRAYELFLSRGATHGHDWGDWLAAERELGARQAATETADYAG